jgi:hypothetical protein
MKSEFLNEWERATENLKEYFVARYFKEADYYWIADEIGGVLHVNDHFFNLKDIVDYIKYNYSQNKMFEHYEYVMKCAEEKEIPINIKSFYKLKNY